MKTLYVKESTANLKFKVCFKQIVSICKIAILPILIHWPPLNAVHLMAALFPEGLEILT